MTGPTPEAVAADLQSGIRLRGLRKHFGRRRALDGVDLELVGPQIVGLAGPDGAGKTTLLRSLAGLLEGQAEQAGVLGHDLRGNVPRLKERVGDVPQSFSLHRELSVGENLAFTARLHRLAAADKMLTETGLGILAVPLTEGAAITAPSPRFVVAADSSVALAYRVIASVPRYDLAMSTRHLEFLIDRNGYVRALWMPEETSAWDDPRNLVQLVGQLASRPLAADASSMHLHVQ